MLLLVPLHRLARLLVECPFLLLVVALRHLTCLFGLTLSLCSTLMWFVNAVDYRLPTQQTPDYRLQTSQLQLQLRLRLGAALRFSSLTQLWPCRSLRLLPTAQQRLLAYLSVVCLAAWPFVCAAVCLFDAALAFVQLRMATESVGFELAWIPFHLLVVRIPQCAVFIVNVADRLRFWLAISQMDVQEAAMKWWEGEREKVRQWETV